MNVFLGGFFSVFLPHSFFVRVLSLGDNFGAENVF